MRRALVAVLLIAPVAALAQERRAPPESPEAAIARLGSALAAGDLDRVSGFFAAPVGSILAERYAAARALDRAKRGVWKALNARFTCHHEEDLPGEGEPEIRAQMQRTTLEVVSRTEGRFPKLTVLVTERCADGESTQATHVFGAERGQDGAWRFTRKGFEGIDASPLPACVAREVAERLDGVALDVARGRFELRDQAVAAARAVEAEVERFPPEDLVVRWAHPESRDLGRRFEGALAAARAADRPAIDALERELALADPAAWFEANVDADRRAEALAAFRAERGGEPPLRAFLEACVARGLGVVRPRRLATPPKINPGVVLYRVVVTTETGAPERRFGLVAREGDRWRFVGSLVAAGAAR